MHRIRPVAALRSLGLVVAVAALFAPRAWADDPPQPTAPEAPETKKPDEKTREAVLRTVDELREEVAKVRGLAWKQKVPADLLTREQLKEQIAVMAKEELDPVEYARQVKILRRLGMLKPDEDPMEIEKKFLEVGIAGFYDPKKDRLFLIDGLSGDGQRPTIFHELVHALEDQYFDLDKMTDKLKKDGDGMFALKCVIEGSAEHGRLAYEKEHPDIAALSQKEQMTPEKIGEQRKMLMTTPAFLLLPTLLNYQTGPKFVAKAVGDDYAGGIERLYADPPVSEEQVLHPEKFLGAARDLPQKVTWGGDLAAAAGEGWKKTDGDEVGELDFALWMDYFLGGSDGKLNLAGAAEGRWYSKTAKKAAEGWDGCWVQTIEKEGQPMALALASVWDTPADAAEAGHALFDAMKARYKDSWKAGEWKAGDDETSMVDFDETNGHARIRVHGTGVEMLEGLAADAFDRTWAPLSRTTYTKDPKDTYVATAAADPFEGAAWTNEKHGLGWKAPDAGWTVEKDAKKPGSAVFKKGSTTLSLEIKKGGLQQVIQPLMFEVMGKAKGFDLSKALTETEIAGRSGARILYDAAGEAPDSTVKHAVWVAGLEGATLILRTEAAPEGWAAVEKDATAALAGFVVKD